MKQARHVLQVDFPFLLERPKQIIEIRTLIKKLGKNHTVILSSHILSEVQAVCDKIIVINEGRIVADDTETNLSDKLTGSHILTAKIEGEYESVAKKVLAIEGVEVCKQVNENEGVIEYRIETEEGRDIRRELFSAMAENGTPILELRSAELSLEDIFLRLTIGEAPAAINGGEE